jgi:hypothetical protein
VLFPQNPLGERFGRILIFDGHNRLQDDRSCVQSFVDEVHRAAREFHAMFERLSLGFESRESRK